MADKVEQSELRQDILTGNWVVIAPERGKKPVAMEEQTEDSRGLPLRDPDCPFCPGTKKSEGVRVVEEIRGDSGEWTTRVIENKYKIFAAYDTCPTTLRAFTKHGPYSYYQGCGDHYLVVEHREHNRVMGMMNDEEVKNVFRCYLSITRQFQNNPSNLISIVFKNQGRKAGASQPHAHSQIVGSRVVPLWIRNALHMQERYFDQNGSCAMCDLVRFELEYGKRVLCDSSDAVVLSPYAAGNPYEVWVVPKRHFACFADIRDEEIATIATLVRKVLNRYVTLLNNPGFNYFVHTSPYPLSSVPFYHMYVQIVPRMKGVGGFEMGTHIPVNPVPPERVPDVLGYC